MPMYAQLLELRCSRAAVHMAVLHLDTVKARFLISICFILPLVTTGSVYRINQSLLTHGQHAYFIEVCP